MDRILIILKKENGPRASSAPALGLNTIIFKYVYWYMKQISGERLQDHWSSGIPILLKLYRCHDYALKICMWFGYNPQINFSHFFRNLNLVVFQVFLTIKVNGQWVPRGRNSSYSFTQILLKLYRCLDHALKICM